MTVSILRQPAALIVLFEREVCWSGLVVTMDLFVFAEPTRLGWRVVEESSVRTRSVLLEVGQSIGLLLLPFVISSLFLGRFVRGLILDGVPPSDCVRSFYVIQIYNDDSDPGLLAVLANNVDVVE